MNRAFGTTLLAALLTLVPLVATDTGTAVAGRPDAPVASRAITGIDGSDDDTTRPTINEFLPEARPLGDCLSSLPKPDCGSEARGGWAQTAVFLAIVLGLAFIAWRVVAGSRRARRDESTSVRRGTPGATTVPDGDGGGPAP